MARHLTDREKKKIIADYAEMGSCNAVAKKHKRSWTTVKQVVESDPDTMKKCEQKKAENMRGRAGVDGRSEGHGVRCAG